MQLRSDNKGFHIEVRPIALVTIVYNGLTPSRYVHSLRHFTWPPQLPSCCCFCCCCWLIIFCVLYCFTNNNETDDKQADRQAGRQHCNQFCEFTKNEQSTLISHPSNSSKSQTWRAIVYLKSFLAKFKFIIISMSQFIYCAIV